MLFIKNITLLVFVLIFGCHVFAQNVPMYIGTYTSNGSQGIYLYDFNEKDGTSVFVKSFALSNPSFLARNGHFLYAVNEESSGAVTAIDLNKEHVLNSLSSQGAHPCHVSISPVDPLVAVSNYSGGSLILYSINSDGSLNRKEDFVKFSGSSVDTIRQRNSHIHSSFFSSDGPYLFVCDLGADLIYRFAIEKESSAYKLQLLEKIPTKVGGGPRHLVVSPDASKLYVVLELTGEIEVLVKQGERWTTKQILPIHGPRFVGNQGAADIKMTLDGKYLYATNRGDANEVAVYKVRGNGELDLIQVHSVSGKSPRNIQLSPNENWVIISNQLSGTVSFFKRNSKTGRLSELQHSIAIPSAVCVVF